MMTVELVARLLLGSEAVTCLGFAYFSWQQGRAGELGARLTAAIPALLFCAAASLIAYGLIES